MTEKDETNKQVAAQCRVVVHLAEAVAEVYRMRAQRQEDGGPAADNLADLIGRWSAEAMEVLGNMLNGMDAVSDDDEWTYAIFEEAQRRWPVGGRHD